MHEIIYVSPVLMYFLKYLVTLNNLIGITVALDTNVPKCSDLDFRS